MNNQESQNNFSEADAAFLCRIVFAVILADLIFSGFSNTLVHQLQSPVLKFPYLDPVFLLMHHLHIPELVTSYKLISWLWDFILFASATAIIFFPCKKWLIGVFVVFYFIYYIIFNSFGAHHTHSLVPFLLTPVVFLYSRKSFSLAWQGLRYFFLFAYSAAFLWKFFRFSWLYSDQGILIIKKNLAPYLYFNPNTFLASVYFWFINHPSLLQLLYVTGFVLEGLFIIGFFTKKWDPVLFIISLILPLGFWFMADALFYEMVLFSLTLLSPSVIAKLRAMVSIQFDKQK
ncbi:MAG: hypothetical protein ACTHML_18710 [Ginsengibacter sp.]